jgi:hypothetical protein
MNSSAIRTVAALKRMDPVKPDAIGIFAKRVGIGQRGRVAAGIPFLAVHGTGMTADADIKVDDETEFFAGGVYGNLSHFLSPRLKAREYILP